MAKRTKKHGDENARGAKSMEGVNVLTNTEYGVYVEGAEKTIEMYEKGELTQEQLYSAILDLEVVYKSKDEKSVESSEEEK